MRRADVLLIASICAAALLILLVRHAGRREASSVLTITVDGTLYGTYPLDEDREIRIGETNVCEIRDGKVRMTEADCPDRSCVRSGAIGRGGGTVVCLPNRVILKTTGGEDGEVPDTVAG